jgi:hypothetical protein
MLSKVKMNFARDIHAYLFTLIRKWCCSQRHVCEKQEKVQKGGENAHTSHQR